MLGASEWARRQGEGGDRGTLHAGPTRAARPRTCGRRHLSRSRAGGSRGDSAEGGLPLAPRPAAPGPTPAYQAQDARHHLRLRQEALQVEGAARLGRAVGPALHVAVAVAAEPQSARNQPNSPAPSSPQGAWPRGRQGPGAKCRPRERRRQVADSAGPAFGAAGRGAAAECSVSTPLPRPGARPPATLASSTTRKGQRVPKKRNGRAPPLYSLPCPLVPSPGSPLDARVDPTCPGPNPSASPSPIPRETPGKG